MDILEDMRVQRAVYWEALPADENGLKTFSIPRELLVRWEDLDELKPLPTGDQQLLSTQVYVGERVTKGGFLWLSTKTIDDPEDSALLELTNHENPVANDDAMEIRKYEEIPTLDGDEFLRIAYG